MPERIKRKRRSDRYDVLPKLLEEAGLTVVRYLRDIKPGGVFVASNASTSRLCSCRDSDPRCAERIAL